MVRVQDLVQNRSTGAIWEVIGVDGKLVLVRPFKDGGHEPEQAAVGVPSGLRFWLTFKQLGYTAYMVSSGYVPGTGKGSWCPPYPLPPTPTPGAR